MNLSASLIAAALILAPACTKLDKEQPAEPAAQRPAETPGTDEPGASPSMTMPASGERMAQLRESCPMAAGNVEVEVSDTDTGVALMFTSEAGNVEDLRRRVRLMAEKYERHGGRHGMRWHSMGGPGTAGGKDQAPGAGRQMGMGMGMRGHARMPEAQVKVVDVDQGAQIVLTPKETSQLDVLREHVRGHRERMHGGGCWVRNTESASPSAEKQE